MEEERVKQLQSSGLSFNIQKNSFVNKEETVFVDILDIKTYSEEKWNKLINKITNNEEETLIGSIEVNEIANIEEETATDLYLVIKQIKELQEKEKELKKKLMPYLKEVEKIDNELFTISYRSASTALTFDSTNFKKAYPDLYMEFNSKIRKTSESMTVKLKDKNG
jgi:predicted phage-related endonuclease